VGLVLVTIVRKEMMVKKKTAVKVIRMVMMMLKLRWP